MSTVYNEFIPVDKWAHWVVERSGQHLRISNLVKDWELYLNICSSIYMHFDWCICQLSCLRVLCPSLFHMSFPNLAILVNKTIHNQPHPLWWVLIYNTILLFNRYMFVWPISSTKFQGPQKQENFHIFLILLQKKMSLKRKGICKKFFKPNISFFSFKLKI